MSRPERQQNVLDLLKGLRGIDPLKQLFWSELNYQRVNQPLSRRGWSESASKVLADDPVLFAGGGDEIGCKAYSALHTCCRMHPERGYTAVSQSATPVACDASVGARPSPPGVVGDTPEAQPACWRLEHRP